MLQFLKDSLGLIFKSGMWVTLILAVVLVAGYAVGRFKAPYVISMSIYEKDASQPKCDATAIELMKKEIRIAAYTYAASINSLKTQSSDFSLRISTDQSQKSFVDVVSSGNTYLAALLDLVGSAPQTIDIFLRVEDDKCIPGDAILIFRNARSFIPLTIPNDLTPVAREVVNTIDDFIPIAELAFDYNTLAQARRQAFTKISEGKQTRWYKNLVAFTYLQEIAIFDPTLNESIIKSKLDSADYWVRQALTEDDDFLPAILNSIYIDLAREKHSTEAYERSVQRLMSIHYRSGCGECLSNAARLRLERFEKMRTSKMTYVESGADLALARNYLEYKIEKYGSTPDDIKTLAQVIGYMERSEYQLYLKDAARI